MSDNHNSTNTELLRAAQAVLTALDHMTTDQFRLGADKPARDALRLAVANVTGGQYEPEYRDYLAYLSAPELLEALQAAAAWLEAIGARIGPDELQAAKPEGCAGLGAIRAAIRAALEG